MLTKKKKVVSKKHKPSIEDRVKELLRTTEERIDIFKAAIGVNERDVARHTQDRNYPALMVSALRTELNYKELHANIVFKVQLETVLFGEDQ